MDPATLIRELRRPQAWGQDVLDVDLVQTHVSLVFLVGERVYKVKKAVDLGFLDFTSLERRKHFCEEEVRLNRRLAPAVYLGVVPLTRGADGRLRLGGDGEPVEWAVEMVRLRQDRMLDRLLADGAIDNALMNELASVLVRFHAAAPGGPGVEEHGSPATVRANAEENFEQLASFVGPRAGEPCAADPSRAALVSARLAAFLRERALAFLHSGRCLFERRVREGRIRDGHGDLHAGNICYAPDGVVAYDCIEFAARFRCADVACDLAFLAMDLDRRGFPAFSHYLVKHYAEAAADPELVLLIDFYKAYRAVVRAKVAALSTLDPAIASEARATKQREAMDALHLAASYDLPPLLILTCGLPGSGKSHLAEALVRPLRAGILRSDVRRKLVGGLAPGTRVSEPWGAGLYSLAKREATYRSLCGSASELLRQGRSLVVDASFSRRAFRAPFLELARELEVPLLLVHVHADEALTRERLARRAEDPHALSDADLTIWRKERAAFEPPDELDPTALLDVESGSEPATHTRARLLDAAIASAGGSDATSA